MLSTRQQIVSTGAEEGETPYGVTLLFFVFMDNKGNAEHTMEDHEFSNFVRNFRSVTSPDDHVNGPAVRQTTDLMSLQHTPPDQMVNMRDADEDMWRSRRNRRFRERNSSRTSRRLDMEQPGYDIAADVGRRECNEKALYQTLSMRKESDKTETQNKARQTCDRLASTDVCPICTFKFMVGENLVCIDCGHVFHRACLSTWFHRPYGPAWGDPCPLCRRPYIGAEVLLSLYKQESWKTGQIGLAG